eukprot:scaffold241038_cov42-Prasinocladus_malaysianus.AAC.1
MAAPQQNATGAEQLAAPVAFNLDVNPPVLAPEFKVTEQSEAFDVKANMQGGENVRLGVTNDRVIHIVGEKKADETSTEKQETFQRAVPLPENVDETKITASFSEGELKMNLPKKVDTGARQTAIPGC